MCGILRSGRFDPAGACRAARPHSLQVCGNSNSLTAKQFTFLPPPGRRPAQPTVCPTRIGLAHCTGTCDLIGGTGAVQPTEDTGWD